VREAASGPKASMAGGLIWGLVFATPLAILLSFVGLLVFYLGLFFFMMFGLLIGALMYRKWAPLRPLGRQQLILSVAIVTLYTWGGALYLEGRRIPINVSKAAIGQTKTLPKDMDNHEAMAIFQDETRRFLGEHYPPGDVVGYLRWMMSAEPMAISLGQGYKTIEYEQRQSRVGFPIRVGLSLVLFAFALGSQVMPLRLLEDGPINDLNDEPDEPAEETSSIAQETS